MLRACAMRAKAILTGSEFVIDERAEPAEEYLVENLRCSWSQCNASIVRGVVVIKFTSIVFYCSYSLLIINERSNAH
jgi:hypothetical protein